MNELLQKHGCSNVFSVPEGLKELMSDISREVLRAQPTKMYEFIANYLSALLITRDHGVLAVKILEDLCDCQATVSERLVGIGLGQSQAEAIAELIQREIEDYDAADGEQTVTAEESESVTATEENLALETVLMREKFKETSIVKKILQNNLLDEETTAKVCQIIRNAYRDYWYRKMVLKKQLVEEPTEAWEVAAQHTLELYKRTKPTLEELTRATTRIQAAYRAYHVRKNLLSHLQPKKPELPPGVDFESSPDIDLGPVVTIRIEEDDVGAIFDAQRADKHRIQYDPMKKVLHYDGDSSKLPTVYDKEMLPEFIDDDQAVLTEKPQIEDISVIADQQDELASQKSFEKTGDEKEMEEDIPEIVDDFAEAGESSSEVAPTLSSYPDTDAGEFNTSAEDIAETEEEDQNAGNT